MVAIIRGGHLNPYRTEIKSVQNFVSRPAYVLHRVMIIEEQEKFLLCDVVTLRQNINLDVKIQY